MYVEVFGKVSGHKNHAQTPLSPPPRSADVRFQVASCSQVQYALNVLKKLQKKVVYKTILRKSANQKNESFQENRTNVKHTMKYR